jgi:uncharacterized membrane protein
LVIVFIAGLNYTFSLSIADRGIVLESELTEKLAGGRLGFFLFSTLVLLILGAIGMLIYTVGVPSEEKFTEFYLLDFNDEAKDYPKLLKVGEEGKLVGSIINRENETLTYRVEVSIDGVKNN